jgi:hypothetical protein
MENQNAGGWIFAVVCCIFPLVWAGIWWAIGRYFSVNMRAARDILRRRDL